MAKIGVPEKTKKGYSSSKVVEVPMVAIELSLEELLQLSKVVRKISKYESMKEVNGQKVNLLFTEEGLQEFTLSQNKEK